MRVLLIIAIVMLTAYCVVEVAQARGQRVRAMPRWLWAFAIVGLPVVGPVAWLLLGRPVTKKRPIDRGPKAPDDDEDFLRGLR